MDPPQPIDANPHSSPSSDLPTSVPEIYSAAPTDDQPTVPEHNVDSTAPPLHDEPANLAAAAAADNIESSPTTPPTAQSSSVRISLLLTSGSRHPMNITKNYLKKRNSMPEDGDPYSLTVYQLKQLIWNDWRSGSFWPIYSS
jgi:hypothetical protein